MKKWIFFLLAATAQQVSSFAKEQEQPLAKAFGAPIDVVYATVVQVATRGYNIRSAVKEGHSVSFFTGGQFSEVVKVICRESGGRQTVVSIAIAQAVGNPQLIGIRKSKNRLAARFWKELEVTLAANEALETGSGPSDLSKVSPVSWNLSTVSIRSAPDGAEITIDGRFSGSTPATLRLPPGDHVIRVKSKSQRTWERTVNLTSGSAITINADVE